MPAESKSFFNLLDSLKMYISSSTQISRIIIYHTFQRIVPYCTAVERIWILVNLWKCGSDDVINQITIYELNFRG